MEEGLKLLKKGINQQLYLGSHWYILIKLWEAFKSEENSLFYNFYTKKEKLKALNLQRNGVIQWWITDVI